MPKVCVLLPARNAAATIDAAMASILGQTFSDFEVLAFDDGSTDSTRAQLDRWSQRDPRVVVEGTAGVGLVQCLNRGLARARSDFIARMDADDECLPSRFEDSLAALEANLHWAGVGTGVEVFRDDRPPSPNLQRYAKWLSSLTDPAMVLRDRFIESPLCHPSVLLRRQALESAGGWSDGPFPEDWDLWLRLLERGALLSCVPKVLFRWRDHAHRVTRNDQRCDHERHLDLKARFLARSLGHSRLALWGLTDTGRGLCTRLQALGCQVDSFVEVDPKKIGQRVHRVPVVSYETFQPGDVHLIACVAAHGAREAIRAWCVARGLQELRDFTCAA